jgi:hypothetical protein
MSELLARLDACEVASWIRVDGIAQAELPSGGPVKPTAALTANVRARAAG